MEAGGGTGQLPADILELTADTAGMRLDLWLVSRCPGYSRSRLQALIAEGSVTVDGTTPGASTRLRPGQLVVVRFPPPQPTAPQPEERALDVVFEDSDLLVIDKPPGLVVHPSPGHAGGTLVNALLHHCASLAGVGGIMRPGIVHRLDKDTSGLMVIAKSAAAHAAMVEQFKRGEVRKHYLALVHGAPRAPEGSLTTTIGRNPSNRKRMAVDPPHGKSAVTHYTTVASGAGVTLLDVRIETGRTHQIRVHMAHRGLPIVGDQLYGSRARDRHLDKPPDRQMLHAAALEFDHPVDGRRLRFRRPPPADMAAFLAQFGMGAAPKLSPRKIKRRMIYGAAAVLAAGSLAAGMVASHVKEKVDHVAVAHDVLAPLDVQCAGGAASLLGTVL